MTEATFVLAAGGTGGHMFPAFALAQQLMENQAARCVLLTDPRGAEYGREYHQIERHIVPSLGLFRTSRVQQAKGLVSMAQGYAKARALLGKIKPKAVVGFGGYASAPTMLAAQHMGIPTLIHEQNSVFGRANRMMARKAKLICTSFPDTKGLEGLPQDRLVYVGNPVRETLRHLPTYQAPRPGDMMQILVTGGSQGAHVFAELMPQALSLLSANDLRHLALVQQVRPEDLASLTKTYESLGVQAQLAPFFDDMPQRYSDAHLIICRSGASSVAEVATVGRPAIFVPLPTAVDDQQRLNAAAMVADEAAWLHDQNQDTPKQLAQLLHACLYDPFTLDRRAQAALKHSHAQAAQHLAQAVYRCI